MARPNYLKEEPQAIKLFVGGLAQETTKEKLREYFGAYAPLKDVSIIYDNDTGRSRRFGFVTFDTVGGACRALAAVPHKLDGKVLKVECSLGSSREGVQLDGVYGGHRVAPTQQENQQGANPLQMAPCETEGNRPLKNNRILDNPSRSSQHSLNFSSFADHPVTVDKPISEETFKTDKIFVGGLPDLTNEEFKAYFSQFGRVIEVLNMFDKRSNRPRGFGFVTFEDAESVEEVIKNYSSHCLKGKWVEVKKAQPRDSSRGDSERRQRNKSFRKYEATESTKKRRKENTELLDDDVPQYFPEAPWNQPRTTHRNHDNQSGVRLSSSGPLVSHNTPNSFHRSTAYCDSRDSPAEGSAIGTGTLSGFNSNPYGTYRDPHSFDERLDRLDTAAAYRNEPHAEPVSSKPQY